jgi:hypothetical protein
MAMITFSSPVHLPLLSPQAQAMRKNADCQMKGRSAWNELSANPISLTGIVWVSARLAQKSAIGETAKR